ncbi:hypothetical protein L2E82_33303 [Cichorium intybus]|uniref:Uncharacterized protein n=1 Tax=Cichorium intybus TaxID=13427 RepID=A0ACB9BJT3_CICIN|nr:hypothetical protein L2E82_33303 [Cichorium intybus]
MAIKKKIRDREVEEEVEKKRARMEDRFSNLPEDLLVHILSFLDTKQAVKTSVLSKRWDSLWTSIPVLKLSGYGSFKNLTVLYLRRAIITDPEPFLGFPVLEKLTLIYCDISTEGETLRIHARNLSELTISGHSLNCCDLTTPKLRVFRYRGYNFPIIRTHESLPVLHTMAVDFNGTYNHMYEKRTFDDLHSLFCTFGNATSLTLFSSTVEILSSCREELVTRRSPFRNLKGLKLDFRYLMYQNYNDRPRKWPSDESLQLASDMILNAYLFHNSPNSEVTTIYPTNHRNAAVKFVLTDVF